MARSVAFLMTLTAALAGTAHAQRRPSPAPAAPEEPAPEPPPAPAAPVAPTGREFPITVAQAVQAALTFNPDVRQLDIDIDIAEADVQRQHGLFQPVVTAAASQRRQGGYNTNAANNAALDLETTSTTNSTTVLGGLDGRTGKGLLYSLDVSAVRTGGANLASTLLPSYSTQVSGRVTQPLLRDAGRTANAGLIDRAELAVDTAEAQLGERRLSLALQVVAAYWTLVVRREEVRIREANVSEAMNLRELVERKIRGGQAPRSEAIQADVTVAERQQVVRQAQRAVVDAERALIAVTFINRGGGFAWDAVLVPAEKPGEFPVELQFDAELALALKRRPEVVRVERAVKLAELDQKIADNQRKMRVDIYGEAGVIGLGGQRNPKLSATTRIDGLISGGIGTSLLNLGKASAPFFEVGVQLEIPLGNADREGAAEQARLRVERVRAQDVETGIALDVRAAMQNLAIARSRLEGARNNEKLALQNVESQRKRYEGGTSTIFDTLRIQDELARARAEIVLAAAEQEVALTQQLAARGTLLEHFGIKDSGAR